YSLFPWTTTFDNRVHDDEQLSHTSHDGYLLGFSCGNQALIASSNHRVVAHGHHGCHVQRTPDCGSTSTDSAFATKLPGISIHGGNTDKGTDLLWLELSQFRQLGYHCCCRRWSYPFDALQQG